MLNVSDLLRIYGDFKSAGKLGRNFADKHRRPVSQSIIRVPNQPQGKIVMLEMSTYNDLYLISTTSTNRKKDSVIK